jgi:hypothetical protein
MPERFRAIFSRPSPIIGMLHAPPLPGAPGYAGDLAACRRCVLDDLAALAEAGVDGVMLENFGDAPFHKSAAPRAAIANLTALACAVRSASDLPLGINVLRNDGRAALAIAQAVGARFIRVNVLTGARVTDQGLVEGIAAALLRDRAGLGAEQIAILADVNVKHSAPLAETSPEQDVADLVHRGGADALIVTGSGTGRATAGGELGAVKRAAGDHPVLVGSGVTAGSIATLAEHADGFIVGTSLKRGGAAAAAVDPEKARELVRALRGSVPGR